MKKGLSIVLVVLLAVSALFANGQKESVKVGKSGNPVIRVGAMPFYLSVPLQVIKDEELDKKNGFELNVISFPSGGPMAEALGADEWDIGPIGAGGMIAIPNYNAKLIADVEAEMDGAWIIARPGSKIAESGKNLKDFPDVIGSADSVKGCTVLGTVGNISHYMAIDYVGKFGLEISDVNFIHMETAQVYTAFVSGNGDLACIGDPAAGMKLLDEGYVLVGGLKQQGNSQQDEILVSDNFYTNHYDLCVAFMKAWFEATTKLNADQKYEEAMVKKFYTENGRGDVSDDAIARECGFNTYVDLNNLKDQKSVGKWMSGLIDCYVKSGTMDASVLDALQKNIKLDIVADATK
jgi:ABC-type nitrate/sulfonate/bicarbonate transport systems, periplasmic components